MSQKASAYNQYGDAAIMSLILDQMPKVQMRNQSALFGSCDW